MSTIGETASASVRRAEELCRRLKEHEELGHMQLRIWTVFDHLLSLIQERLTCSVCVTLFLIPTRRKQVIKKHRILKQHCVLHLYAAARG
jgi:hypothetical protein